MNHPAAEILARALEHELGRNTEVGRLVDAIRRALDLLNAAPSEDQQSKEPAE